ncbi:hypothetical protein PAERUG_E15_London_28_01_14_04679 [Pseudomonas aeruginosa]|jgi:hypothetical protein|nr:hypothetical protein PAERUG_E15_London_28_01_14_04679 [Pseudomonas aeruginosa]CRQ89355.1 hypothetical protein PAERUG_E16_London_17_VIM_2_04_14_03276 [Pseudomonas aeruginosa]
MVLEPWMRSAGVSSVGIGKGAANTDQGKA